MKFADNLLPFDGEVYYYPDFFSEEEGGVFFESLLKEIQWRQEPISIFGKKVMQPRLTAWYGDEGKAYSYSGITMPAQNWTPTLLKIKERIESVFGIKFNSALLNQYRDQNDSVGWHRDNEKELGINPIICSVSFGAPREFQFRHLQQKNLKQTLVLQPRSVLIMKGSTQQHWAHAIPKRARPMNSRINITFRNVL